MWTLTRDTPQVRGLPSRFEIVQPPTQSLALLGWDRAIAISPDGRYIAYRAGGEPGQLVLRALDSLDPRVMAGTTNVRGPFFSPDSRWIGFFDGYRLKKISIAGGSAVTICPIKGDPRGASWGDDDAIVFATNDTSTGLLRVSAGGGEPTVLTMPDAAKGERSHYRPSVLPGGRGILFTITTSPQLDMNQVAVLDLKTRERRIVVRGAIQPEYVDGHLLYANDRTLYAIPFDIARLAVLGVPVPVIDDLSPLASAAANYAISRSGTLVYVAAAGAQTPRSLVWVDRKGQETQVAGAPQRLYTGLRLSPDGMRIAVSTDDQDKDIWIWEFGRRTFTRLIFNGNADRSPVWTSDNQHIVFSSRAEDAGEFSLFRRLADGRGAVERLTTGDINPIAAFVAADGTGILGTVVLPKSNGDVVWFPLKNTATADRSSGTGSSLHEPLVQTEGIDYNPALSPDGRFLAYQSNQGAAESDLRASVPASEHRSMAGVHVGWNDTCLGAKRTGAILPGFGEQAHCGAG